MTVFHFLGHSNALSYFVPGWTFWLSLCGFKTVITLSICVCLEQAHWIQSFDVGNPYIADRVVLRCMQRVHTFNIHSSVRWLTTQNKIKLHNNSMVGKCLLGCSSHLSGKSLRPKIHSYSTRNAILLFIVFCIMFRFFTTTCPCAIYI